MIFFLRKTFLYLYITFASFLLVSTVLANTDAEDQRQLLQLTEYIGVDYSSAIAEGNIIDQGEYQEMLEFSAIIVEQSTALISVEPQIRLLAKSLQEAIQKKQSVKNIQYIATELKTLLLGNSPQLTLPQTLLSTAEQERLYQRDCSSCHGVSGKGDGIIAEQFIPAPTDFTDQQRAMNRSVLGLYDVISGGIEGTAMSAYQQLSTKQRWSLAFYSGSLAFNQEIVRPDRETDIDIADLVMFSPNELLAQDANLQKTIIQLRANPDLLFADPEDPLTIARSQLHKALSAYQQNNYSDAKRLAVSAYLDGFELLESALDAHDQVLRKQIESALLGLRQELNGEISSVLVGQSVTKIFELLDKAEQLLTEHSMSDATLFSASFIILLREGLEALLVVIALFTILMRSGKKEAIKYLHFGWVTALFAGVLTWVVAQYLITISGASREIMEGVAAMLAAVVLFYVGFWMHSKTQANQWQAYMQRNIDLKLKSGTLWGISGLAFIAVYREVFETVLFYQALLTQTSTSQEFVLIGGFGFAVVVLTVFTWLMIKYSVKLPIGRFFSITTFLLLALSFVMAGKAISALQEAALIAISPMPVNFQFDWLGINSTWQGVSAQLTILLLSMSLFFKQWLKNRVATD